MNLGESTPYADEDLCGKTITDAFTVPETGSSILEFSDGTRLIIDGLPTFRLEIINELSPNIH